MGSQRSSCGRTHGRPTASTSVRLARLEALLWYPLLILSIYGLFRGWSRRRWLGFPALSAGGIVLVYALTEGNIGTAFRHRAEAVWAVALFAALGAQTIADRRARPVDAAPQEPPVRSSADMVALNDSLSPGEQSRPMPSRRTVIGAGAGGASWGETWRSRELLRVMVWRDFTLRYKQTFVGAGWAVLQPLGLTAVLAIFLGRLVPLPVTGLHYAAFMLPAMVLWQFFSKSLQVGGVSLSTNYDTVTKVFFPRIYLPLAMIAGGLIDFGFTLLATAFVLIFYQSGPGPALVLAPAVRPHGCGRGDWLHGVVRRLRRKVPRPPPRTSPS